MSSNPPILAVPASVPEPFERVQNYRLNQMRYAAQHAAQGKEEIDTEVGLKSFRNHLPPTPNRSMVLSGGSSVGSNGSRSRGMVARMKPRNPGIQPTASLAFSCAPTEIDTIPLQLPRQKTLSFKNSIVHTATPIPLEAYDHPVPIQRPAVKGAEAAERQKRQREEEKASPGRNALLCQRVERRRAKAAILKPKHNVPSIEKKGGSNARETIEEKENVSLGHEKGVQRVVDKARQVKLAHAIPDRSSDLKPLRGSRVVGGLGTRPRAKGVEPVSHFKPDNVAGRDGRITARPRGVFNKGTTSGLYKVVQPEASAANRAFSESRFFRQPPPLVNRSGAGPSSSSSSGLGFSVKPTGTLVGALKAAHVKSAGIVATLASASLHTESLIRTAAASRRVNAPARSAPKSTTPSNPPPFQPLIPDVLPCLKKGVHDDNDGNAPDSNDLAQVNLDPDRKELYSNTQGQKTHKDLPSDLPPQPLPISVSNRRHRRDHRRPAPQLPPCQYDTAPLFGSAHNGDLLGFLTAPQAPPIDEVDARLASKEQEYLDELSLDSFENRLFQDDDHEVIPTPEARHHPDLDIAEEDARAIWRPRRI